MAFPIGGLASSGDPAVARALRGQARRYLLVVCGFFVLVGGGFIAALVMLGALDDLRVRRFGFVCSVGFSLLWGFRAAVVAAPVLSVGGHSKGMVDRLPAAGDQGCVDCEARAAVVSTRC